MASRRFKQFRLSLETAVVDLYMNVSIGASGAPTLSSLAQNQGIASMIRNSAGNYTITLSDPYARLMGMTKTSIAAGAPSAPLMNVVSSSVSNAASPQIVLQMRNDASVAADPANGESLLIHIELKNSSVQ